jgi:hypothetical protein
MITKVAWSITHQEFTITDYYYFSILQREAEKHNIIIEEVDRWEKLKDYDTIVFNYPEIPFTEKEAGGGRKVGFGSLEKRSYWGGYYKNEDHIADTCNTLARRFGMELNPDEVIDETNNHNGEKYFVVTSKIRRYNKNKKNEVNVEKIMLACSASIKPLMPDIKVVVRGEDTAVSNMGNYTLLIAEQIAPTSGGYFCLAGTCVFWDNYSITLYNNLEFSLNLLRHQTPLPTQSGKQVVIGL